MRVTPRNPGRYTRGMAWTDPGMRIFLNGEPHDCAAATTVAALLAETGRGEKRVAVEVNREIVPRSRHTEHTLQDGDRVEIVQAIGGG